MSLLLLFAGGFGEGTGEPETPTVPASRMWLAPKRDTTWEAPPRETTWRSPRRRTEWKDDPA